MSQENKAKELQKEALKFSTQKALDNYSDTITESVNALQSCEKGLEYLLSYARQQNSQLLQDFKASDFPILQENLALMVQGLREYFKKTGYLKLVYKSDAIAQDILHTLQAHSLKPCDFQMVYALGKLKQAQKQTFQTLVDDLSDLSSLYPNLDPLLKQYITSFEDLIAQQKRNKDKEAFDPYWVRSLGADFGEKQRMEPEELQREADRLIRNGLGSFVRFVYFFPLKPLVNINLQLNATREWADWMVWIWTVYELVFGCTLGCCTAKHGDSNGTYSRMVLDAMVFCTR